MIQDAQESIKILFPEASRRDLQNVSVCLSYVKDPVLLKNLVEGIEELHTLPFDTSDTGQPFFPDLLEDNPVDIISHLSRLKNPGQIQNFVEGANEFHALAPQMLP